MLVMCLAPVFIDRSMSITVLFLRKHIMIIADHIRSLYGSDIYEESLELAAIMNETLPNTSAMVQFLLFKTLDLAVGEYSVM